MSGFKIESFNPERFVSKEAGAICHYRLSTGDKLEYLHAPGKYPTFDLDNILNILQFDGRTRTAAWKRDLEKYFDVRFSADDDIAESFFEEYCKAGESLIDEVRDYVSKNNHYWTPVCEQLNQTE